MIPKNTHPRIGTNLCAEILDEIRPDPQAKLINDTVEQLIKKHMLQGDFSCLLPREKEGIRNAIKEALGINLAPDPVMLGNPNYRDNQEMLDAALAFEKTLIPLANKRRQLAHWYPWGWCYVDSSIQEAYRKFYIANKDKPNPWN